LLQQQQQQQAQQQQQQAQQQQAQGLGVVYQLPSAFMQPLSALTPALTSGFALQGLPMYTTSLQPGIPMQLLQPQQQLLMPGMQLNGVQLNGMQQLSPSAQPFFTFGAVPAQQQQQQQPGLVMPAMPTAAQPVGSGGLFVVPGTWPPQYIQQDGPSPGSAGAVSLPSPSAAAGMFSPPAVQSSGEGWPAAAAPTGSGGQRRGGRSKAQAPVAAGGEKPKGPSQRFRSVPGAVMGGGYFDSRAQVWWWGEGLMLVGDGPGSEARRGGGPQGCVVLFAHCGGADVVAVITWGVTGCVGGYSGGAAVVVLARLC
jgi:hypothetical protein